MIPTVAVGDTVFSDTYARFAAALLGDVGRGLMKMTGDMDMDLMSAGRDSDDAERVLVQRFMVDVPAMTAAANYCHWVSDHVLDEIARIHHADMRIGEQWATASGDADGAALFRLERRETLPDPPPWEPPPFPAALQHVHRARRLGCSVDEKFKEINEDRRAGRHDRFRQGLADATEDRYARRLGGVHETLVEASSAIVRNRTDKTNVLIEHVDALSRWAVGTQGGGQSIV